jgi:hypothetical protein
MATRLEISKRKLERLEKEAPAALEAARKELHKIPLGQPNIIGRPDIYKDARRLDNKARALYKELDEQKQRVRRLENAEKGLTASGGLKMGVYNIDRLQARIKRQEKDIAIGDVHQYSRQYLNNDKRELAQLIKMRDDAEEKSASMTEITRGLISDGSVKQWAKKPIYYFVTGLKKVALVIDDNGEFAVSQHYPAVTTEDKEYLTGLGVI